MATKHRLVFSVIDEYPLIGAVVLRVTSTFPREGGLENRYASCGSLILFPKEYQLIKDAAKKSNGRIRVEEK